MRARPFFFFLFFAVTAHAQVSNTQPPATLSEIYTIRDARFLDEDKAQTREALLAHQSGNFERALNLVALPALRGVAQAQYLVGRILFFGEGVERNLCQAMIWHDKAARQGLAESQLALALGYRYGWGVRAHIGMAYRWAYAARAQNAALAQEVWTDILVEFDKLPPLTRDDWIKKQAQWDPTQAEPIEYYPLPEAYLSKDAPSSLRLNPCEDL